MSYLLYVLLLLQLTPVVMAVWPGVIFVPCDNKQPIRYLLTLNRHDTVKQLRSQFVTTLDEDESWDLIIAEVFNNHIARVLVSLTLCLLLSLISFTHHSASIVILS